MFYFLHFNIEPITKKVNQEVSSSWAYSPYSPRIMCMPKDNERKSNPKRLNNPTAIYASCVLCTSSFVACKR